jgi:hypothetical protein
MVLSRHHLFFCLSNTLRLMRYAYIHKQLTFKRPKIEIFINQSIQMHLHLIVGIFPTHNPHFKMPTKNPRAPALHLIAPQPNSLKTPKTLYLGLLCGLVHQRTLIPLKSQYFSQHPRVHFLSQI